MAKKQTKVRVAEKQIHEMSTKEFRAYVRTLTPEEAEWARRARRAFTKARWAAADPEHVAAQTTRAVEGLDHQPQRGEARGAPGPRPRAQAARAGEELPQRSAPARAYAGSAMGLVLPGEESSATGASISWIAFMSASAAVASAFCFSLTIPRPSSVDGSGRPSRPWRPGCPSGGSS